MSNFIREFWLAHAARWDNTLVVRFPPEPNGYLHIGHVKALLANADLADAFGGTLLLRMDDTNPSAEKPEYEAGIIEDLNWLGVAFDPRVRYASDHFLGLLALAWRLVDAGEAYVDLSSKEALSAMRGDFNHPGTPSPDRSLPASEHRVRFARIVSGDMAAGSGVLRAKMDLASPNMVLRDPVLWRRMDHAHPRLPGWVSFPTYDFAHPFCDLRDGVSLSLCSLEFEDHRPLYDHVVALALAHGLGLGVAAPMELEFARLDPDVGMTSKRTVRSAVESGAVTGWDDPRLLTLRGLRSRGYAPDMIKRFVRRLGVGRALSKAPMGWLDEEVRSVAGNTPAGFAIADPLPLHISGTLPEAITLPDGRAIAPDANCLVSREDVRSIPEPGFYRLSPGAVVRLMGWGGFLTVDNVETDPLGYLLSISGRFHSEGKSKATVHVLPRAACLVGELIHTHTWDGVCDPATCETKMPLAVEHGAADLAGTFHAPRLGWLHAMDGTKWRLLAGMVARPAVSERTPHRSA